MNAIRKHRLALLAVVAALPFGVGHAQLGGLIKKKAAQAAAAVPGAQAVTFDNVVLELTPLRLGKVIAGKKAGQQLASGPAGPAAIRRKLDALEAQQSSLYEQQADAISAWDEKRRAAGNCRDSVLIAAAERLGFDDPQFRQKATDLSFQYAAAMQRGDSAEIKRLEAEIQRLKQPSRADTLRAAQTCPVPTPPPAVQQWLTTTSRVDSLKEQHGKAEQAVRDAEESTSGMSSRQLAVACERIQIFVERYKAKKSQAGFTAEELVALEQAIKELEALCT